MNVDEALRRLGAEDGFPREAMEWALAHWSEAAPRFVSRLRTAAAKGKVAPEAASEMFFIVHLCGDRGEALAYEPLCRLIAADAQIEDWLGDGAVETLPGVLIKIYDGDTQPLVAAIASPNGDPYAKSSALVALAWLVAEKGALSREDMRSFLRDLSRNPSLIPHEVFWEVWASLAAQFGFGEFRNEVARQNRLGHLDGKEFDVREFDAILERVRRDPADRDEIERFSGRPFEDTIGTLERWEDGADDEASADEGDSGWLPETPYVNPLREIGRNDPCPCGSGKKYKKCCLVA